MATLYICGHSSTGKYKMICLDIINSDVDTSYSQKGYVAGYRDETTGGLSIYFKSEDIALRVADNLIKVHKLTEKMGKNPTREELRQRRDETLYRRPRSY